MSISGVRGAATPLIPHGEDRRLLVDLFAYGLASGAALIVDYALLMLLIHAGLDYRLAAGLGFTSGMAVAYTISARFVFADRRAPSRHRELAGFVAVGLGGLVLTQVLLLVLVSGLGCPVALAKIPTAGSVFLFNFLCRRTFVFATCAPRVRPSEPSAG